MTMRNHALVYWPTMRLLLVLSTWACFLCSRSTTAFTVIQCQQQLSHRRWSLGSSETTRDIDETVAGHEAAVTETTIDEGIEHLVAEPVDPKEAVKVFGRLAEKYIALDSSGGMCCYSACSDCEFRIPGGGYIMADQSAARPKWIPHYESRNSSNRAHETKWSTRLFVGTTSLSKDDFVTALQQLDYVPPLGGPYVGASAAAIDTVTAMERLFDALADGKTKLTKNRMSIRLKQLSDGEEGMTWQAFERVMGLV